MTFKVDRNKLKYLGVFLCFLILELSNITKTTGFIDENDNFLAGMTLVKGGVIYLDYISQHMPFMYYLCAIFNLLGAHSEFLFRLYFYVFIALIWTIMYVRYSKYYGRTTMLLYPVFYISNMYTFFTSCVLSDQMQSIGMVILLMEFLIFIDTNEVKIKNEIAIAFAILISFGSAFISVYAIFIIALGVAIIEIHVLLKNKM
ncbi:MAG: hypothetical protein PHX63_08475, partial [Eubacteriales bacterium]|nr:hypothetical protein [Eubacteriales bacterium]